MSKKYPNSNPDNHRIGKLGEQTVYKIINSLHHFNRERSIYRTRAENLGKQDFIRNLVSEPDFRIRDCGGDSGVDLNMLFAKGYGVQVKTRRLYDYTNTNSIQWIITQKEIRANRCFVFVIDLGNYQKDTYMVVGFLPSPRDNNDENLCVTLHDILYPAGAAEFLDDLELNWNLEGRDQGSPDHYYNARLKSVLAHLFFEQNYSTALEYIEQSIRWPGRNPEPTLFQYRAIIYYRLKRYQEASQDFEYYLDYLIKLYNSDRDGNSLAVSQRLFYQESWYEAESPEDIYQENWPIQEGILSGHLYLFKKWE